MRALSSDEMALLEQATLGNVNWCGERFTLADVGERPEFAHYMRIVPERGDFGVVAEQDGKVLGVAWAVFLPSSDPGYGFVDEHTPEVSLWVDGNARRQGLGLYSYKRSSGKLCCVASGNSVSRSRMATTLRRSTPQKDLKTRPAVKQTELCSAGFVKAGLSTAAPSCHRRMSRVAGSTK